MMTIISFSFSKAAHCLTRWTEQTNSLQYDAAYLNVPDTAVDFRGEVVKREAAACVKCW